MSDPRRPVPSALEIAERYVLRHRPAALRDGLWRTPLPYFEIPLPEALRIAEVFDAAPLAPAYPELLRWSYRALRVELLDQWLWIHAQGIHMLPWQEEGQPYAGSEELFRDLRDNRRMHFFRTDDGFGEDPSQVAPGHPLLALSPVWTDGKTRLRWNDLLRAVHDVFGHAAHGNSFGPRGEFNAWQAHARMFSPACWAALASETLAQNFWVNFGPHLRREDGSLPVKGDPDFIPPNGRPFAAQKLVELPAHLCNPRDLAGE